MRNVKHHKNTLNLPTTTTYHLALDLEQCSDGLISGFRCCQPDLYIMKLYTCLSVIVFTTH